MPDYNFKEETRSEKVNGRVKRYKWYSIQAYIGKSADGKKVYKRFSGRDKNELLRQIAAAEAELKEVKEKAETKTLGEALEEYIVSRTAVASPSTIRGYRVIQKNAFAELQKRDLFKITQMDLQAAVNEYAAGHSPKSCRNAHGLISAVMQLNRPDFVPRTTLPQKEKKELYVPDEKEINQLYEMLKGSTLEIPFLLASQCGLRASEIAALKLENVFDDHISIKEACVPGENGSYHTKAPKSYAGYRDIPISEDFAKKIRDRAATDTMVCNIKSTNISNSWCKFRDDHNLKKGLGFHELRHHFASKCLLLGMPQKYIAELMGHSSTDMIEKVYQHVFPSAMEEYADKLRAQTEGFSDNTAPIRQHQGQQNTKEADC